MIQLKVDLVQADTNKRSTVTLPCNAAMLPWEGDYLCIAPDLPPALELDNLDDLLAANVAITRFNAEIPALTLPWLGALATCLMVDTFRDADFVDMVCEQNYYFADLTPYLDADGGDPYEIACRYLVFDEGLLFSGGTPEELHSALDLIGEWLNWDAVWENYEDAFGFQLVTTSLGTYIINFDLHA